MRLYNYFLGKNILFPAAGRKKDSEREAQWKTGSKN